MKIGIVGGIHEDIVRLREAFAVFETKGCSVLACLGDISGFTEHYYGHRDSRDAHACIRLVKEKCRYTVIGNHDLFAIKRLPRQTEFAYPDGWYELDLPTRRRISADRVWLYGDDLPASLTADDIGYLGSLPEFTVAEFDDARVLLSHYVQPNLVGDGVNTDADESGVMEQHFRFMASHRCELAVFDHDCCDGLRMFTKDGVENRPFGRHPLPAGIVVLNGPWVANGTSPNGVMVVDLVLRQVEAIPLGTPVHSLP